MPNSRYKQWRQAALLVCIPTFLAAGPIVGYLIGDFFDRWLGTAPWLMVLFTVLGGVSGVRQTLELIARAKAENEEK